MLTLLPTKTKAGSLNPEFLSALKERLPLAAFVETGTFQGDSAAAASALFPVVHTIELAETLAEKAKARFASTPSINVHQGDSAAVLAQVVATLQGPTLFWLDGHYSEGVTAFGGQNTPILEELATIARSAPEGSVILVDDLRLFDVSANRPNLPPSMHGYPALTEIYARLAEMGYQFFVLGDVGLAVSAKAEFAVSPVIQALTVSRLYDGENLEIQEVLEAENIIQQASGQERGALLDMPKAHTAAEKLGVALHYRFWRALSLLGQGHQADAGKDFLFVAEHGFHHWRVRWNLASILASAGELEAARALLDEVLEAAPDFAPARALSEKLESGETVGGRSAAPGSDLDGLKQRGLWREGQPLRLHLGCGEQRFKGYVNIDYPADQHNVMSVRPDYEANIVRMEFPPESVDEIRLHHVFEHFNRVTALAMLIKWQQWLKVGGKLHIETPDLKGSAEMLVSDAPWKFKMGAVRHLAGDQAASWAYHVDHWFPERYQHTLQALGFGQVETKATRWPHEPHLSNVHAFGVKTEVLTREQLVEAADGLLWESTLAPVEKPTYEVWRRQLRAVLAHEENVGPANIHAEAPAAPAAQPARPVARPPKTKAVEMPAAATSLLPHSDLPLAEIHDFNQRSRDRWVKAKAATVPAGSRVLDIGAGTCLYRPLFAHCDYKTHDFKQYTGREKHGNTSAYGHIDYVSEILAIPVPDHSFDVILCTEVLEHVPEPIKVLREISRILKPGGRAFITAPLGSGLHQLPFHFYGGYTPEWYKRFSNEAGLDAVEITPNGGFFKHLAQECARAASHYAKKKELHGPDTAELFKLLNEGLPRLFFALDEKIYDERFTVGYFVEAVKAGAERLGEDVAARRQPRQAEMPAASSRRLNANVSVDVTRNDAGREPVVVAKLMGGMGNQMFQYAAGLALARRTGAKLELDLSFLLDRTPRENFTFREFDLDLFNLPADCAIERKSGSAASRGLSIFKEKHFHFDARFDALDANTLIEGHWQSPRYFEAVADEVRATFSSFRIPLNAEHAALAAEIRGRASVCLNVRRADFVANPQANAFHGVCAEEYFRQAVRVVRRRVSGAHFYIFSDDVEWCRAANLSEGAPCTVVSHDFAGERFSSYLQLMMACRHFIIPNSSFAWWAAFLGRTAESIVVAPAPWFSDLSVETADLLPAEWMQLSRNPGPSLADLGAAPAVSVVVPCYKQAHYLQECVESVVSQTFADWELLIVNDGSPDDTSRVTREIIERHPERRIRLVEKANGGLADARNAGIREAGGRYILPLDADDRLHPEMLARTVAVLEADPKVAIAYTDLVHFGAVTKVVRAAEYDFKRLPQQNQLNACSLFRREAWVAVGGYNRNMTWGYEDWDFWVGCGEKGHFGRHVPEPLLYYRVKDSSMYTKALEHHRELHAQIVLNHPRLFPAAARLEAEQILSAGRTAGQKQKTSTPSLVSVVIPCYEQAQFLTEAVESVVAQTYPCWEIVIVNDGSPDATSPVAQRLILKHAGRKIRLIEKKNGGLSDARNAGVRVARGRYILPLDADDRIAPEFLAKTVALLDGNPEIGIAYTDWVYFGGANFRRDAIDYDFARLCGKENLFTCTSLYRREAWDAVGGYNSNMTRGLEDWDFWIGCGEKGFRGRRIPEPLFFYRAKNGSMIQTLRPHLQAMFARIILNHPSLYSEALVEKAKKTFEAANLPPPKPSSPGVEWSASPGRGDDFAAAVTAAESLLRSGHVVEAKSRIEQALEIAPNAECATRAREILAMLEAEDVAGAAGAQLQPAPDDDFFAADEFANIERIVAAYGENPGDAAGREELQALQQGVMKFVVTTPVEELERRWKGNFATVFRALMKSGLAHEPPSEAAVGQCEVLDQAIADSVAKGAFDFRPLLARMLVAPAHRGTVRFEPDAIPGWLVDDYLAYVLHAPDVFVVAGEADEYHGHVLACLRAIVRRVRTAPRDALTRQAVVAAVKMKFIPLYFASGNTREAVEARGQIIEYFLRQKGATIDYVPPKRPAGRERIRVGFLNAHFGAQTETHVTLPMLQLDREKFEVQLFAVAKNPGPLEDRCRSFAEAFHVLPASLDERVETVRRAALDVVVIGTNVTAVTNDVALMATHRLAPLQLVSYCSPVSTGLKHVDGYITGTLNDGPGLQAHFSETLRYCEGAPGCFDYAVERGATKTFDRTALGIGKDDVVFVNAGACYKILPEMQETWAKILKAVPDSRLLLLPFNPNWSRAFPVKQFERTLVAACERHGVDHRRLILAGSLPSRADVKALERVADIYLDTYPFSGSISVVDPLELGLPVVVRQGPTHRGRMAAALLREIGMSDLICQSEDDYIETAARLARDPVQRHDARDRIAAAMATKPKFIDPAAYAHDLGGLLESLVSGARPAVAAAVA